MPRRWPGFSLGEVLIALAVLVPVIVVTMGMFPFSHAIDRRAWAIAQAEDLARTHLERARAQEFDSVPEAYDFTEQRDGLTFTGRFTSRDYDPGSPSRLKKISVLVTWRLGRSEQFQLDSLVARRPR
ncbi:MAG TPA: hypothetical protein VNO81_12745 [Candidatus Nitrosotenuis sp.]|jgi:Tfp pilus assembly protein PilV|nr:hypothetical protein [Candidatus Nitrosotenuis sp.]